LLGVPSASQSSLSTTVWSSADSPSRRSEIGPLTWFDGLRHALAAVAGAAVAQLDGLVDAGRGAGGDDDAAEGAGLEADLDLDGGIAARVEDLSCGDASDLEHAVLPLRVVRCLLAPH
jgi:hypothetical protein